MSEERERLTRQFERMLLCCGGESTFEEAQKRAHEVALEIVDLLILFGWTPPWPTTGLAIELMRQTEEEMTPRKMADQFLAYLGDNPEAQVVLKEAGWLPPCKGRRVMEGKMGPHNCMQCGMPFEINDELIANDGAMDNYRGRNVRLILDPLPEKEGEG